MSEAPSWEPRPTFRARVVRALSVPLAVAAAIFAVAAVAGVVMVATRPHAPASLVEESTGTRSPAASEAAAEAADGTGPLGGGDAERLVVHVVGEVRAAGIVELEPGARVQDAIEEAGGPTEFAVLSSVNLARPVSDGEQIVVPNAEAAVGTPSPAGETVHQIDVNAADATRLEELDGVGPALAQRIIEWREQHGRFASVEQLLDVPGIGVKTLERFGDQVRV